MNLQKVLQELSNCKSKKEIKRILRNRRNARDLYSVISNSTLQYKNLKIKPTTKL